MTSRRPEVIEHRFIDEAGDTTFFGKGGHLIVGEEGVSRTFSLTIVKFTGDHRRAREAVESLQSQIPTHPLYRSVPSVIKRSQAGGFHFHASKDLPEIRAEFLKLLMDLPFEAETVVARKIPSVFRARHGENMDRFYGDVLSHLLKGRLKQSRTLVFNIASRGSSTRQNILSGALKIAEERAMSMGLDAVRTQINFNVQNPTTEPLINVADYVGWCVSRVFERGEIRFFDTIRDKVRLVLDLYDSDRYEGSQNYYRLKSNPLTADVFERFRPPTT